MNDQRNKDVLSVISTALFSFLPLQARLLIAFVCLVATSLAVASDQTNKETLQSRHISSVSSPEHVSDDVSLSDQSELSTGQPKVFECESAAQSKAGVVVTQPVESLLQRAGQDRHAFSCLSPVQSVYEGWSSNEVLLIDVRRPDEFQQYQIPGSLNLTPFSIQSKRFLKNKRIVLVNEGHYLSQLEGLCLRLKDKGFQSVAIMAGGLHAWHQARYPLNGDRLELSKLSRISPDELVASLYERDWMFIDVDQSLLGLSDFLPESSVIEYQVNKGEFISAVNQANKQLNQSLLAGFVVVNSQGENYKQIQRLLQLTEAKNIFYLSGGISELKRFLNTHSSLISRSARGFKEAHRCSG
ncbi:MAG: rhodanese-like domain-containing protein [Candidatus Thiodiazotropha sp.]